MPTTNSLANSNETPRPGHGAQGLGSSDVHFDGRGGSFGRLCPPYGSAGHWRRRRTVISWQEIPITLVGNAE